ncbi:MAG TPA: cytochrome c oxidase assembly protein, partial [Segeticoccus sp.]|nr:cytochrome c oxidase assembly protein [Segeticoccus sp.]
MTNVESVAGATGTGQGPGTNRGPGGRATRGGPHVYLLTALVALGLVIPSAVLTGAAAPPVAGLSDPGAVVRWGLPLVRAVQDISAAATIGLLLMGGFLVPEGRHSSRRATSARYAVRTAAVWTLSAAVVTVLGFADLAGEPLSDPGFVGEMWASVWAIEALRVTAVTTLIALAVTIGTVVWRSRAAQAWLCLLSLFALLPLALGGHAGGSADHDTAVNSLAFHLIGVALWVGGLLALVALRPLLGKATTTTVERYSTLAGWCFVLVAFSGVLNAWVRVGSIGGLATAYGLLVVGKSVALVLLGLAGWQQRRAVIRRLREDRSARGAFTRLATAELVVMGAAIGMATVLARSAPPVPDVLPGDRNDAVLALTGYARPEPLHWSSWVTAWQVEWLFATVTVLALGLYLAGVLRMHRRGDHWPVGRTVAWVAGWLVFAYLTNGAPAVYGRVMFSVHMSLHMTLSMVVPILLVLAAPVTLALRTLRPRHDKTLGPREVVLAVVHSRVLH